MKHLIILFTLFFTLQTFAQILERVSPESLNVDARRLPFADNIINEAIENGEIPGAVLAVVHRNKMVYLKAFGNKQIYPSTVAMSESTIFDLASVTKPIVGGISAMILVEQGKLRLTDRVSMYIPEFQDNIRVVDLLTHTSGLPSYPPVGYLIEKHGANSADSLISYLAHVERQFAPRTNSQYSCNNLVVLQRIIEIVSGQNLRDFTKEHIFDVLGMENTDFVPTGEMLNYIAPTIKLGEGEILRGIVHDPLARVLMGGISGNAGLFSNADDLAILSVALLNGGEYNGKRILSPQGVKTMISVPQNVAEFGRALGWDVSSAFASNQGDLLSASAFGHTGYTGTSLVIDPELDLAIILLTNRVHPYDTGNIAALRARVANVVASAVVNVK